MAKNIVSLLYNRQVCVYPRGSFACTFRPSQIQLGMRLGRKFEWVGGVFPDAGNLLPDNITDMRVAVLTVHVARVTEDNELAFADSSHLATPH